MERDKLSRLYVEAVEAAIANVGTLAEEADYSPATVRMYVYSERPVSSAAAEALADALDDRAKRLKRHADALRKRAASYDTRGARRRPRKKAR